MGLGAVLCVMIGLNPCRSVQDFVGRMGMRIWSVFLHWPRGFVASFGGLGGGFKGGISRLGGSISF